MQMTASKSRFTSGPSCSGNLHQSAWWISAEKGSENETELDCRVCECVWGRGGPRNMDAVGPPPHEGLKGNKGLEPSRDPKSRGLNVI